MCVRLDMHEMCSQLRFGKFRDRFLPNDFLNVEEPKRRVLTGQMRRHGNDNECTGLSSVDFKQRMRIRFGRRGPEAKRRFENLWVTRKSCFFSSSPPLLSWAIIIITYKSFFSHFRVRCVEYSCANVVRVLQLIWCPTERHR